MERDKLIDRWSLRTVILASTGAHSIATAINVVYCPGCVFLISSRKCLGSRDLGDLRLVWRRYRGLIDAGLLLANREDFVIIIPFRLGGLVGVIGRHHDLRAREWNGG